MTDPLTDLMLSAGAPLAVVTTVAEGVRAGCVVGFHGQSSIHPERYAVWLSKANHTYRVGLGATHLAVHFLTDADLALVERFGTTSGEDTDKFAGLDTDEGPGGVPLLAALPNRLVGRRRALLDLDGDHVCVELEVEQVGLAGPFEPMRLAQAIHLRPGHAPEERSVHPDG